MTLDEAIKHAEKKAFELGKCDCASEHIQLAKWLKELKTTKIINIQEHIRFFNKVLALTTIYAKQKVDDLAYVELHGLDVFEDNGNKYLNVSYSYTRFDNDVIPDFTLISLDYLDLDIKDAEQKIKEFYKNENNNPTD